MLAFNRHGIEVVSSLRLDNTTQKIQYLGLEYNCSTCDWEKTPFGTPRVIKGSKGCTPPRNLCSESSVTFLLDRSHVLTDVIFGVQVYTAVQQRWANIDEPNFRNGTGVHIVPLSVFGGHRAGSKMALTFQPNGFCVGGERLTWDLASAWRLLMVEPLIFS
jgi:hypothetical protein